MRMNEWNVILMLCDAAEVADGKLFVLGGGWSLCGPGTFVHALAIKLEVPWDQANRLHKLSTELVTEDGQAVRVGDPPSELQWRTDFEVGRPPGLPGGTALDMPFAINLGPMDLPPDNGYSWVVKIDGSEVHRARFRTRPTG